MIEVELAQRYLDARRHQRCHSRIRLQNQHHAVALWLEIPQGLSERSAAKGAPVQVVHATIEGALHGGGGYSEAGGHTQPANLKAGPAESSDLHVIQYTDRPRFQKRERVCDINVEQIGRASCRERV